MTRVSSKRNYLLACALAVTATYGAACAAADTPDKPDKPVPQAPSGKPKAAPEQEIADQTLRDQLRKQYPLKDDVINAVKDASERQDRGSARAAPKFEPAAVVVSLDPTSPPPVVHVEIQQPTAIAFVDMTGAPWPIAACHFSPGIDAPKDAAIKGTHIVPITPQDIEDHVSAVCILEGLTTPIALQLEAGTGVVNTTFVARIAKMGPKATAPLYELQNAGMSAGDSVLQKFLLGTYPENAVRLPIQGAGSDTQAWRYDGFIYVRTPLILWSPAPAEETKLDDMHVYKVQPLPLLQMSQNGQTVSLHIEGARALALDDAAVKRVYKQSTDPTSLRLEDVQ